LHRCPPDNFSSKDVKVLNKRIFNNVMRRNNSLLHLLELIFEDDRSISANVIVDEEIENLRDKHDIILDFVKYCCKELKINANPSVEVVHDRDKAAIVTTAHYNIPKSEISVYGKGRYLPDVLRSIAHELVHMSQHENGELEKHPIQHIGGYLEDDANARAGSLVKSYGLVDGNKKIFEGARRARVDE
jgi:hypothetical protein